MACAWEHYRSFTVAKSRIKVFAFHEEGRFVPYTCTQCQEAWCATACPVSINTGDLTKRFRSIRHTPRAHQVAILIARNFALVERGVRTALRVGHAVQSVFGPAAMMALTRIVRSVAGSNVPLWTPDMPRAACARRPATQRSGAQAVYFPSCISRTMGRLPGEVKDMSVMQALVRLGLRAHVPLYIPDNVSGHCCGVPFSSKGFDEAHKITVNRTIERFWEWSEHGRLPIVIDTSPCTYGLITSRPYLTLENQQKFDHLRILDSVAFVHDTLLPKLQVKRKAEAVALHPVCSVTKMNLTPKLEGIARACSEAVTVPVSAGCCGFAGDRGFLHPELTDSATQQEARELATRYYDGYFSSSRTCEVGMTRATGQVYRSFLYLLEQATR
jgi:D-lactate dehydrogenase